MNPDAQIGIVQIGRTGGSGTVLKSSNIVAGVTAGSGGGFGDGNDTVIPSATNSPAIFSKIASLIINGGISGNGTFGAAAQNIVSVSVSGSLLSLTPGPANDAFGSVGKSDFSVFEAGASVL